MKSLSIHGTNNQLIVTKINLRVQIRSLGQLPNFGLLLSLDTLNPG